MNGTHRSPKCQAILPFDLPLQRHYQLMRFPVLDYERHANTRSLSFYIIPTVRNKMQTFVMPRKMS